MKGTLQNRIAITFAFLTAAILAIIFLSIYLLNRWNTRQEFFASMTMRASIAAQVKLERDELSQKVWEEFRQLHLKKLPEEEEYFLETEKVSQLPSSLPAWLPENVLTEAQRRGIVQFRRDTLFGVAVRYNDNQGNFTVIITAVDREGNQKLFVLRNTLLLMWLGYILGVFFIGRWYAKRILFPIRKLTREIRAIHSNNLSQRIELKGSVRDELSELSENFNDMLDRIQHSLQLRQNFISNASHQLSNPLTAVLGELEVMREGEYTGEEYRKALARIEQEAYRINILIQRLLKMVQTPELMQKTEEEVRIDDLLTELKEEFGKMGTGNVNIDFSSFPAQTGWLLVRGNPELLKVVFSNVIENAFKYSGRQEIRIHIEAAETVVRVLIADDGPGISQEEQAFIFEPFFRGKNAGKVSGYGIGLSMVAAILKIHRGQIDFSSDTRGSVFVISLPVIPS